MVPIDIFFAVWIGIFLIGIFMLSLMHIYFIRDLAELTKIITIGLVFWVTIGIITGFCVLLDYKLFTSDNNILVPCKVLNYSIVTDSGLTYGSVDLYANTIDQYTGLVFIADNPLDTSLYLNVTVCYLHDGELTAYHYIDTPLDWLWCSVSIFCILLYTLFYLFHDFKGCNVRFHQLQNLDTQI